MVVYTQKTTRNNYNNYCCWRYVACNMLI